MEKKLFYILIFVLMLTSCMSKQQNANSSQEVSIAEITTPSVVANNQPIHETESGDVEPSNVIVRNTATTTQTPSSTPELTRILPSQTSVNTPLPSLSPNEISGIIFGWSPINQRAALYGYFDPILGYSDWNIQAPVQQDRNGANNAFAFSFSQYSGQIAYLVWNEYPELWIADIAQKNNKRLWVDVDNWLNKIDVFPDVRIIWGVDDRYILLSTYWDKDQSIVYDLTKESAELWSGGCDIVARSPINDNYIVWCENLSDRQHAYAALEKTGIIITDQAPKQAFKTIDWAVAPDGQKLIFADDHLDIYLSGQPFGLLKLAARYQSSEWYDIVMRRNLKWSMDGGKVLVYAFSQPTDICPLIRAYATTDDLRDRPCWQIYHSLTGEFVGTLGQGVSQAVDVPWEYLSDEFDATFSMDGEKIATTLWDVRIGEQYIMIITSLKTGATRVVSGENPLFLQWINKK